MRYCLTLLAALLLVIPADGAIPIPYVQEDQIKLDGNLDDWYELLGPPVLTAESDFSLWQGSRMHVKPLYVDFDPDNLDFSIWLGWSPPGRVFVAAEFQDDHVLDGSSAIFVQTDGMTISVTPDSREEEQTYAIRPKWIKPLPYPFSTALWSLEEPFSFAAWAEETPTSWGFEFFISCFDVLAEGPDDSVVSDLAAGDEISLSLAVMDHDVPKSTQYAWFNLNHEDVLLLSPGETAVLRQSWGRIKAAPTP